MILIKFNPLKIDETDVKRKVRKISQFRTRNRNNIKCFVINKQNIIQFGAITKKIMFFRIRTNYDTVEQMDFCLTQTNSTQKHNHDCNQNIHDPQIGLPTFL